MKKFIFLTVATVISALWLSSCSEKSSDKDEIILTWKYNIEVVDYGGMSEENKSALDAAIDTLNKGLSSFQATVSQAEIAFDESILIFKNSFAGDIAGLEHTSAVVISVKCSSSAKTFHENLSFE